MVAGTSRRAGLSREEAATEVRRFTDGCTFCPDRLLVWDRWRPRWVSILGPCSTHDQRYAIGGDEADRLVADLELREGILAATGGRRRAAAEAIFRAVRAFGGAHFNYRGTAA